MAMQYETLKRRVAADVCHVIIHGAKFATHDGAPAALAAIFDSIATKRQAIESLEALADEARSIINRWDVRAVGRLRELFPASFPRTLRTGPLVAEIGEDGAWWIAPAGQ